VSIISVPPVLDELDDTTGNDDNCREDASSAKHTAAGDAKEDAEKSRKRKRASSASAAAAKKADSTDGTESPAAKIARGGNRSVESPTPVTSSTRLRKSSVASHEASSGTETEKESNTNEDSLRARRRCSTRVSTSEGASKVETTKPETSAAKTVDLNKRKSLARR
jgi:hypothetical protein